MTKKRHPTPLQVIIDETRWEWASYSKKHAAIQKQTERVIQDDGRYKTMVRCAHCQNLYPRSSIEANHKKPVGPLLSVDPDDIAAYRQRMFCKVKDIEALCKPCHRNHTNTTRKENRECKSSLGTLSSTTRPTQTCQLSESVS
jgi:hypothetical protein